ncbi:MAG TPA: YihY/virulence factor BrkB family protein [Terriglobales bacterium]|nr:YihY/virulence factor BrkB family protein [Terriglobales bacterium]
MTKSMLNTDQQIASIWQLGGLSKRDLAKRVWQQINEDNVLGRASELAYNFLLSIFPLLLFLLALFGLFASRGTELKSNLFFHLSQVLPPAAYQLVTKTITEVANNTGSGKLTFGLLFALWSASGGMTTMISVLDEAYGVRESRSWIKVHLVAIGLTIAISVLVLAALAIVLLGGWLAPFLGAKFGMGPVFVVGWKILQYVAALCFIILSFALIYYFAPDVREQHWYWITPGSVVGVGLWILASFAMRMYLHFFNSYSRTYGSLGAVIILLLWFYVTGLAFLIGGETNSEIEHAAAEHGHPEAKAEGEKESTADKAA